MRLALLNLLAVALLSALSPATLPALAQQSPLPGQSALVLGTGGAGLKVRSGPGPSHDLVGALPEGKRVEILDGPRSDGEQAWYRLESRDGSGARIRGWASAAYLLSAERIVVKEDGTLGSRTIPAKVTSYASGGPIGFYTATGTRVQQGTVSVDPRFIPLGSLMTIEGIEGVFIAEDVGSAVKGAIIDVWVPDLEAARRWGTQQRNVTVLREGY